MLSLCVLGLILIRLATSLLIPPNIFLNLPSKFNATSIDQPITTLRAEGWPKVPKDFFVTNKKSGGVVTEATWMNIKSYETPGSEITKGYVTNNLSLIIQSLEVYEPSYYVDNTRAFSSGPVTVRFPAGADHTSLSVGAGNNNAARITNALAVELLYAAAELEYVYQQYGPKGWTAAEVETVRYDRGKPISRKVIGYFSLEIDG